ncbi:hypothetical protein EDD22DRAFT_845940 [Suillus occidentalis]|nr:hypothetical protein EDD22DRAFT_845940 [Suillus occidentalis]
MWRAAIDVLGWWVAVFESHKAMVKRNVLHGDFSPNNFIIFDGCGYFIDFDHAQIITEVNTSIRSWGTGTVPYMSIHLLRVLHTDMGPGAAPYKSGLLLVGRDKELMERTMVYFGRLRDLVQDWRLQFLQADEDNCITHKQIERILDKWISDEAANEPPLAQTSSLSPTNALAAPGPRRSSRKTVW